MKKAFFTLLLAAFALGAFAQTSVSFVKAGQDSLGRDSIFRVETAIDTSGQYTSTAVSTLYLGTEAISALFAPKEADIAFRSGQIAALQAEADKLTTALNAEKAALQAASQRAQARVKPKPSPTPSQPTPSKKPKPSKKN